jgi:hypothetical protein
MLRPATIDTQDLLVTVLGSLVAGVGITVAFALSVLGFARAPELREQGRPVVGAAFTALGVACLAVALGAVFVGLAILAKDSPLA